MPKIVDLTGQRFGKLRVLHAEKERSKSGSIVWNCLCDCGNMVNVRSGDLRKGHTKSCGCLNLEKVKLSNTKHGYCKTRIYKIYHNMKTRCYNSNTEQFKDYGSRGIKICDEWLGENGFKTFYDWAMKNGYTDDLTIDRIDVNGNYEPSNCRWVNMKTQANNTRSNDYLTYNGETHTLQEWADITGIHRSTISDRIRKSGWSVEKALTVKARATYDHRRNKAKCVNARDS